MAATMKKGDFYGRLFYILRKLLNTEVSKLSEYGYVRVSSIDQNEGRQMTEMRKL